MKQAPRPTSEVGITLGYHPKWTALLILLWLLFVTGCKRQTVAIDPSFFPIGIYSVRTTNVFAAVKEAGFNVVTGPADRGFLDAAQVQGLKVLASPGTSAGPQFDGEQIRRSLRQFDSHPALWAWYLIDEPDLHNVAPAQVQSANRFLKSLRPAKPTALVLFQGYEALHYANITDILMVDRYPIPWLPLANFGQHIQMARMAVPRDRPLIAVIQAFDWNSCPELLTPRENNLRPPTEIEMRCMTYDALARGANGLFYYAFDDGRWRIQDHAETWTALKRVVAEVNARLPLFQAEQLWWARNHAFADPKHRYNAALESSVTSCLLRVKKGNSTVPPGNYILAVNNTEWNQTYSFEMPGGQMPGSRMQGSGGGVQGTGGGIGRKEGGGEKMERSNRSPVITGQSSVNGKQSSVDDEKSQVSSHQLSVISLGEGRTVRIDSNRVTDDFAPYAVHVYGPF